MPGDSSPPPLEGPIELDDRIAATLFEAAPDGQVIVDASGTIVRANTQAYTMFGWPEGQMVGRSIEDLVPERFRESHGADRQHYHGEPHIRPMGLGMELRARRFDDSEFPVEIALSPLETDRGLLVIASVRDITERLAKEAHAREIQRNLIDSQQELQLVEDRERIARELHDTVIQRLFATGMGVAAIASRVGDEELADRLNRVVDDLDTTILDIRTAIFGLQGGVFGAGLRSEVLKVTREAGEALGFEPRVQFVGPIDAVVSTEVAEHLVPTLREALANVARHSGANAVEVTLRIASDALLLEVVDNGVGPPAAPSSPPPQLTGRGLINIAHRAERLGGHSHFGAGEDVGAVLRWQVPLTTPRSPD